MDASLFYFPSAVGLGALHALEPGHAKTLTAAYLIGTKGTKRDAVVLGLSVAFAHSIVVVVLAGVGVWLGKETFTDRAMYWLQIASGVIVMMLGAYLLYRRWPRQHPAAEHGHDHHHHHHHAPLPVLFQSDWGAGTVSIIDTPNGERFRVTCSNNGLAGVVVRILRPLNVVEELALARQPDGTWQSEQAPKEPHEFDALLELTAGGRREELPFHMAEPAEHTHPHDHEHPHDHDHLDEDEEAHARAHAATLPDYVRRGERPTALQIMAFGAAGGLIPCPAAVTVMLLAISVNQTVNGFLLVIGFSLGLALSLVGIGVAVVMGLSALGSTGRFAWFSRRAPVISAAVVIVSGAAALIVALAGHHA